VQCRSAGIDLFEREDLAGELRAVGDELLDLVLSPVASGAGAVRSMLEITPCPPKGPKKTYEIFLIARGTKHCAQLKSIKKNS
jgi:hypothetical protein